MSQGACTVCVYTRVFSAKESFSYGCSDARAAAVILTIIFFSTSVERDICVEHLKYAFVHSIFNGEEIHQHTLPFCCIAWDWAQVVGWDAVAQTVGLCSS